MASTTSRSNDGLPKGKAEVVDMATFGRELMLRRQAAGNPEMPRNSGNRRTPSKRALLKAIEEAGGKW